MQAGTVILADDDAPFRASLAARLRVHGYVCLEAGSGTEVIGLLASRPVDVVVADIHMPGNEQLELATALASMPVAPGVILITGQPELETAVESVRLAVRAYLVKPFTAAEIDEQIERCVRSSQIARSFQEQLQRCHAWANSLLAAEGLLGEPGSESDLAGLQAAVAIDQIAAGVETLRALHVGAGGAVDRSAERAASDGVHRLLQALQQTVLVLERTKQSFRSKELGQLRERLERLLAEHLPEGL